MIGPTFPFHGCFGDLYNWYGLVIHQQPNASHHILINIAGGATLPQFNRPPTGIVFQVEKNETLK
jgi:hypothetical protein